MLSIAYKRHPERFVRKEPSPQPFPEAVWINPPKMATSDGKLHKIQPTGVSKSLTYSDCWQGKQSDYPCQLRIKATSVVNRLSKLAIGVAS